MFKKLLHILLFCLIFSCYNEIQDPPVPTENFSSKKSFTDFDFSEFDCSCNISISNSTIVVYLPAGTSESGKNSLTPVFQHNGYKVTKLGILQYSGTSGPYDFSSGAVIFRVYAADNSFTDYSVNVEIAASEPAAPTASSVSISGNLFIGETLNGNYTYSDINGDSEATSLYRWLRSDTFDGVYSEISGATSSSYTATASDNGKYLKFEVTPVSNVTPTAGSPVLSNAIGPFTISSTIFSTSFEPGDPEFIGVKDSHPFDIATAFILSSTYFNITNSKIDLSANSGSYFAWADSTSSIDTSSSRHIVSNDYIAISSNDLTVSVYATGRSNNTVPLSFRITVYWFKNNAATFSDITTHSSSEITSIGSSYIQVQETFSPPADATHMRILFDINYDDNTAANKYWAVDDVEVVQ